MQEFQSIDTKTSLGGVPCGAAQPLPTTNIRLNFKIEIIRNCKNGQKGFYKIGPRQQQF